MICVYPADCRDFTTNGNGTLTPISATVTETLNGEYEVQLEHPIDAEGKWQRLVEGCILRVPVPAGFTPAITVREQTVQTATDIYAVIDAVTSSLYLWANRPTEYPVRYQTAIWNYRARTEVAVISKSDPWYEVIGPDGKHGWMYGPYLRYVRTESSAEAAEAEIRQPKALREQPFRIYRVVPELDKITVYARHIFYDLLDNMVKSYKPTAETTGAEAVQGLAAACLTAGHGFSFYSDLTSTAEDVEVVNKNPVDAILGDEGLLAKYGGELLRDWFDVYVVSQVGSESEVRIRQAKDLLGIKYDVDLSDVVTRIMPTGTDKDGEPLYLPELYVDSPLISQYPQPKWIHLDVKEAKEGKSDDGETKTKEQCYTAMRDAAQAEYDKGCDMPTVSLDVDFLNCLDTEEYKEYGFLQGIFLGDTVHVIAPRIGVNVALRMTQYTYDCLTKKYGMAVGFA